MPRRTLIPFLLALSAAAACARPSRAPVAPLAACTFANPVVADGADPWVVRKDGHYYFVQSSGRAIHVFRTDTLTRLARNGVQVWAAPDTGWNRDNIWAPELHYLRGHWYIYYAGGQPGRPFLTQHAGVLESVTDDPQGAWVDRGQLYTGDSIATRAANRWAIDLTVAELGGQLYAVWSGWERDARTDSTPQHLYIARMTNPWTIATNRVEIVSPTASYEVGTRLNLAEGPEFLERGPNTFVVYSTRESWLPDYRLAMIRLTSPTADPLDPASWVKVGPVFTRTATVYGPGHASFTTSEDGSESWIVYHVKNDTLPNWKRRVQMQRFSWRADGTPDFGTPVDAGVPLRVPSGECPRS